MLSNNVCLCLYVDDCDDDNDDYDDDEYVGLSHRQQEIERLQRGQIIAHSMNASAPVAAVAQSKLTSGNIVYNADGSRTNRK